MVCHRVRSCCGGSARRRQTEVLTDLIHRYVPGTEFVDTFLAVEGQVTTTERGIPRWENQHLVTCLDVLNDYQIVRRARCSGRLPGFGRRFRNDPRTRFVELLKFWLRMHAAESNMHEDEVRRVVSLCRGVLYRGDIFTARTSWSFMHAIEIVYEHLQMQLRVLLGRNRSCTALVEEALGRAKNLLSDVVTFLLTGPTDFIQTDILPSAEIVTLWRVLPPDLQSRLASKVDDRLQKGTRHVWRSSCGAVIAALLTSPGARQLFGSRSIGGIGGMSAESEAELVFVRVAQARKDFAEKRFKASGLAGPFRKVDMIEVREAYLEAATGVFNLMFLLGSVFIQFHSIGSNLGDYGMIRMASWLHPFLSALEQRVKQLKSNLETLNTHVEEALVLARARGSTVPGPVPTTQMRQRAAEAVDRAILARVNHYQEFVLSLEALRAKSDPERLPKLEEDLSDACTQLHASLTSTEFRMHIGEASFDEFRRLGGMPLTPAPELSWKDKMGEYNDEADETETDTRCGRGSSVTSRESADSEDACSAATPRSVHSGRSPSPRLGRRRSLLDVLTGRSSREASPGSPLKPPVEEGQRPLLPARTTQRRQSTGSIFDVGSLPAPPLQTASQQRSGGGILSGQTPRSPSPVDPSTRRRQSAGGILDCGSLPTPPLHTVSQQRSSSSLVSGQNPGSASQAASATPRRQSAGGIFDGGNLPTPPLQTVVGSTPSSPGIQAAVLPPRAPGSVVGGRGASPAPTRRRPVGEADSSDAVAELSNVPAQQRPRTWSEPFSGLTPPSGSRVSSPAPSPRPRAGSIDSRGTSPARGEEGAAASAGASRDPSPLRSSRGSVAASYLTHLVAGTAGRSRAASSESRGKSGSELPGSHYANPEPSPRPRSGSIDGRGAGPTRREGGAAAIAGASRDPSPLRSSRGSVVADASTYMMRLAAGVAGPSRAAGFESRAKSDSEFPGSHCASPVPSPRHRSGTLDGRGASPSSGERGAAARAGASRDPSPLRSSRAAVAEASTYLMRVAAGATGRSRAASSESRAMSGSEFSTEAKTPRSRG